MVRFGQWDRILALPLPDKEIYVCCFAFLTFARGLSYGVLGKTIEGRAEEKTLADFIAASPELPQRMKHNVPVPAILSVAVAMLDGELCYREEKYDRAFEMLQLAVNREDELPYDEPWGWLQPTRHAYAALLAEQEHFEEAEEVYREDLRRYPLNVWSLVGLDDCVRAQGKKLGKLETEELENAKKLADWPVKASCACALSKMG